MLRVRRLKILITLLALSGKTKLNSSLFSATTTDWTIDSSDEASEREGEL